jgi:O-antigen/teichoic acid export membrane protein
MSRSFAPTLFLVGGRTVAFAATFFIPVVLVRLLSQAEFGTYKQVFLVFATLYAIAQFGMAESLFYFVPRAPRQARRYVVNSALFLFIMGLAGLAIMVAGRSTIASVLGNDALAGTLPLLGVFLVLMLPSAVLEIVMIARGRYRPASVCYGASDALRAVFLLAPVALLGWRLEGLLLGAIAFAALRLAATLGYLARAFPPSGDAPGGALATQLAYAIPFGLAGALEIAQATFHQYAVSYRFDAATFAIYAVGCFQVPLVDFIATSAGNVLMVQLSDDGRRAGTEARTAWHRAVRELALMLVPLVGLLLVGARDVVVLLFTASYLASVPIFMIWSAGILLAVLPTDAVLRVHAQTRFILGLSALRLALLVVLLPWCLAAWGLIGAVLATVAATALAKGVALRRVQRLVTGPLGVLLPWRTLAGITAAAAMAAAAALAAGLLETTTPARLLVTSGVYAATYLILLFVLGVVTEDERAALARRASRWTQPTVSVAR